MGKLPIDLSSVTTVGLDLAKHVFFVHAVDDQGEVGGLRIVILLV